MTGNTRNCAAAKAVIVVRIAIESKSPKVKPAIPFRSNRVERRIVAFVVNGVGVKKKIK